MPSADSCSTLLRIALRLCGSTPTVGSSRMSSRRPVQQSDADVQPPLHAPGEVLRLLPGALGESDHRQDLIYTVIAYAYRW